MSELLSTDLYKLVQGRHGRFLANPMDVYIGRSLIEYGEFSEGECTLLTRILRPGSIAIEAGANMGAMTVPMAKQVGDNGLIYAFEPQMSVFQQLCANLALNDLMNVQAFQAGCGDRAETLALVRPNPARENNFGGFSLNRLRAEQGIDVPVHRLDALLDPPRLQLLKADVEGMELQVVRGAAGLIARYRPVLYLETSEDHSQALFNDLLGRDYQLFWHQPRMFNPDNFNANPQNHFGNVVSRNILCVPAEAKVEVKGLRPVSDVDDFPTKW